MAMMKCPECGNDIQDTVEYCPYCGVVFEDANEDVSRNAGFSPAQRIQDAAGQKNDGKGMYRGLGIVLVIIGIITLIASYRTGFLDEEFDMYEEAIEDCIHDIQKYEENRWEVKEEADKLKDGFFKDSYNQLVEDWDGLINDKYEQINSYKEEQHRIVMKAIILLVISIGSFISAVALIRKTKITSA